MHFGGALSDFMTYMSNIVLHYLLPDHGLQLGSPASLLFILVRATSLCGTHAVLNMIKVNLNDDDGTSAGAVGSRLPARGSTRPAAASNSPLYRKLDPSALQDKSTRPDVRDFITYTKWGLQPLWH